MNTTVLDSKITDENKENIFDASVKLSKLGESPLTPYQGIERRLGHFKCIRCNKTWISAHSWANTSQKCLQCEQDVYPHIQVRFHMIELN